MSQIGIGQDFGVRAEATTKSVETAAGTDRFLAIEVLRFLCAFGVLCWHFKYFYYVGSNPVAWVPTEQPLYGMFSVFYDFGNKGVRVFWAISGFIFAGVYTRKILDGRVSLHNFAVNRFSRLYPLHILTFAYIAVLQIVYLQQNGSHFVFPASGLQNTILQFFMATNWLPEMPITFNGPIWSVTVEIIVYLIFFLITRRIGNSLLLAFGLMCVNSLPHLLELDWTVSDCASYFYAGVAAFACSEKIKKEIANGNLLVFAKLPWALHLTALVASLLLIYCWAGKDNLLLAAMFPLLIAASFDLKPPASVAMVIKNLGAITYSVYLIHFPLQLTTKVICALFGYNAPLDSPTVFIIFVAVTLISALALYHWFEMPCQDLIRRKMFRSEAQKSPKFAASSG